MVSRRQLIAWGDTDTDIRRRTRTGDLRRLRPGWFALPQADERVAQAVAAGGTLGCASALRWYGVWVLDRRWHVRAPRDGLKRVPPGATVCRCPASRQVPRAPIDDLGTALVTASSCLAGEEFVAALDSVVNLGLMHPEQVALLFANAPVRVRRLVAMMDRAESGTETLVRLRLRALGITVQTQAQIDGVGRVDLLIGDSLVIEVDSVQHHTSASAYQADRLRDRRLRARGYVPIRLTFEQVIHDWGSAEADIRTAMARRDHRRRVFR